MKKKTNPIVVIIIILMIILGIIIYLYVKPESTVTTTSSTSTTEGVSETSVSIQNIENTLSSSGQVSSALDEKVKLHASYYFEELLVDTNVLIEEGTNIVEYTNGTYLTAPYDCVLISSNLPNEDEICTTSHYIELQSIDTLCMNLNISETDIAKVTIGDEVDVTITSTNEKLTGFITSISEVGTYSSSGSYFTAVVTFDNTGTLKIGMSATCEIIVESVENAIAVPNEAIQTSDEGKYVIVVNEDGTTTNTNVETGISNDAYTEIKSGLTENEKVQMTTSTSSSSSTFSGFKGNGDSSFSRDNMSSGGGMPSGGEMPTGGGMPSGF